MEYYDFVLNAGPDFESLQPELAYPTKEAAIDGAVLWVEEHGGVSEVVYSPAEDPNYDDYIVFRYDGEIGTVYKKED